MMQEHRWKARGAGPISVWESVQNLNAGSCSRYFEVRLNSAPKKSFEARLSDRERSGSFHSGSGMRLD
jgi:hypothetical protein